MDWNSSERALLPWLFDPDSTQHSYLFGWLLKSDLFHCAMLFSSLTALGGWRRLSLTSLAGFSIALPLGEFLGGLDGIVAPGYHYGWLIWGGIYLSSWVMGFWLQKMDKPSFHSKQLRLWILICLMLLLIIPVWVLLGIPGYARA